MHESVQDTQKAPALAFGADGTLLVVFEDTGVPTGLRARLIPVGTSAPAGDDAHPVGDGASAAGTHPALAPLSEGGFVLVFEAGEDLWLQRLDAAGAPMGPARPLLPDAERNGVQRAPAVASLEGTERSDESRILVAWEEQGPWSDGDGTTIRAVVLDHALEPIAPPFVVPTTTVGDQRAPAATALRFERAGVPVARFVVAWIGPDGARGRLLSADGVPQLNREPVPTADDFRIAPLARSVSVAAGGPAERPSWAAAWDDGADVYRRLFPLP